MADKTFRTALLITGDGSGAQRAIKLTAEQLDDLNSRTKEANVGFKEWEAGVNKAALAAAKWAAGAALAAGAAAAAMVKSAIDSAEATGILAGKLGITTEALSKLQYAAKLSDVTQASLEAGMKKLTRTLTDAANGTGSAAKAFDELGLSARKIIDLPADEQLGVIADALNKVENASEKAALAQRIFGKGAVDMLPLLAEGSAGIKALGAEAERLGIVISEEMAEKSQRFNDSVDRLKAAVSGLGIEMASFVVGPLADFSEGLLAAFNGPALGDLDRISSQLKGLRNQLDGMVAGRAGGTKQADELREQIKALEDLQKASLNVAFANVTAGNSLTKLTEETKKQEADQRREIDALLDSVFEKEKYVTATQKQTTATRGLTDAQKEQREDEMASIFAKAESDKGLYETTKSTENLTAAIVQQVETADPWAEAMTGAVERIDAAFADAWLNIGDGFGAFADDLKAAFNQLLAELAHMAITKPIIMAFSSSLGMGGAASGAMSGGGLLSKIPGIGGAFAPGGLAPFLGQWGVNSGVLNQSFGAGGMGPPQTSFSLSGLGMNLGAGLAGNYLADSLMSGRDSTGYGSMVGGLAGSWFGPIGTGVGAFVGEAIDRALSGSDFSGKRVKLGVMTGSSSAGLEGSRTLASGLQVGNVTRRAGDAGLSDEQIQTYLSAFDALDSTLTGIARGAGANVDFSKIALAGMPQNYDGGTSGQAFFGSLAKGELRDTLTKAPDEFVRQWLVAIDDELSQRVKGILGDTAGKTAGELIGLFGFAVDIDRLLSIDVIKAAQDSAESASRTIMSAYDDATAAVVDLAQQYDGTAGSMTALTEALAGQKEVAAVLAAQYQQLESQINGTFGSAIDYIRESVMSEEDLYQRRRDQILYLTNALTGATDPSQISAGVGQIDRLARDAFGLLSPDQQASMASEFVTFLEQAQQLAQSRVDAGQDSLAAREKAVQEAVNLEVMSGAAQVQQAAANTFAGAVAQFTAVVGSLQSEVNV